MNEQSYRERLRKERNSVIITMVDCLEFTGTTQPSVKKTLNGSILSFYDIVNIDLLCNVKKETKVT